MTTLIDPVRLDIDPIKAFGQKSLQRALSAIARPYRAMHSLDHAKENCCAPCQPYVTYV
jgi:hypothetical protein